MTPRTGRPPSENPRTKPLSLWVTAEEYEAIKAAAAKDGQAMSVWMREWLIAAATGKTTKRRRTT